MTDLSTALENSISEDVTSIVADLGEVGLDSILDEGALRDVPFLSTAISLFKIGKSIRERHYIKKLHFFILKLNQGVDDDKMRLRIRRRITEDSNKREKELEYLLILIDRYTSEEKAGMLAKLYLAFLDQLLSWEEVTKYSEVIDRLLPGDYEAMQQCYWNGVDDANVSDNMLRLIALGIVISHDKEVAADNTVGMIIVSAARVKDYELTDFGMIFLKCMRMELG